MTLAGNMKLRNFLILAVVVAGAGIFGLTQACKSKGEEVPAPSATTAVSQPPPAPSPTPTPAPAPTSPPDTNAVAVPAPGDLAARPYDAEVIAWSKRSITGDKMKDATKGKPYKLNLYKDAGQATVNRAKLDLDRDDKFDEKYTFETSKITLQRAPNDDEQYSETYHWNGTGWTKE